MPKKLTYPLLLLAVLVWGVIIYRLAGSATDVPRPPAVTATREEPALPRTSPGDTLKVPARDPFLGTTDIPVEDTVETPEPTAPVYIAPPAVAWPDIQYTGELENPATQIQVFLLTIGGSTHLLRAGDTAGGVVLQSGSPESVTVSYAGESREIHKP